MEIYNTFYVLQIRQLGVFDIFIVWIKNTNVVRGNFCMDRMQVFLQEFLGNEKLAAFLTFELLMVHRDQIHFSIKVRHRHQL